MIVLVCMDWIANHTPITNKPVSHRPKELAINIAVDELMSVQEIDLDVGEKALHLKGKESPKKYHLDVVLPNPINSKVLIVRDSIVKNRS